MSEQAFAVDFVGLDAVKYACTHWHYSRSVPAGRRVQIGVWEHGQYIGCVVFSRGASQNLGRPWGLTQTEICELTRVALDKHETPVTQIVAAALRLLKRTNPGLRLVVSFADREQGHHGGIYQAGGWVYTGTSGGPNGAAPEFVVLGKRMHSKSVHSKGWKQTGAWLREHIDPQAYVLRPPGKHRYVMPLDKQMRRLVRKHELPNPPPETERAQPTRIG